MFDRRLSTDAQKAPLNPLSQDYSLKIVAIKSTDRNTSPIAAINCQELCSQREDFIPTSHLHAGLWSGLSLSKPCASATAAVSSHVQQPCCVWRQLPYNPTSPLALTLLLPLLLQ